MSVYVPEPNGYYTMPKDSVPLNYNSSKKCFAFPKDVHPKAGRNTQQYSLKALNFTYLKLKSISVRCCKVSLIRTLISRNNC